MTKLPPTHAPQSHTTPNPSATSSSSKPKPRRTFRGSITPGTAAAPIAAFVMAILLYTYSVTSINAAKRNAALHRQADGGQLDMRRESLRRHGALERVEGTGGLELFRGSARGSAVNGGGGGGGGGKEGVSRGGPGGDGAAAAGQGQGQGQKAPRRDRTEVEGALEGEGEGGGGAVEVRSTARGTWEREDFGGRSGEGAVSLGG